MVVAAFGLGSGSSRASQPNLLTLPESAREPVILCTRLPKTDKSIDWEQWLAVYVDDAETPSSAGSVQGTYRIEGDTLSFRPDFPFSLGVKYRVDVASELTAVANVRGVRTERLGREFVGIHFSLPASPTPAPPKVKRIFPTSDELPENILRFYIYFSNPMQRGWASRSIRLFDEKGNEVKDVFMEFKQELWSSDQKRLTLLLDPGRIKRGVATNVRLGQALVAGHRYKLVVDGTWPDGQEQLLATSYEKAFRVTPAVRSAVEIKNWVLNSPIDGSKAPLELTLDRPLDHALLQRMLSVCNESGDEVPGRIELGCRETKWLFYPQNSWNSGAYHLTAQSELEDLAGNNLNDSLDHRVGNKHKVEQDRTLTFIVSKQLKHHMLKRGP